MKSAINYVTVLLISCLLSLSSHQSSFAVEIAKKGESIMMLGDHKCFSWTLAGIKYVQKLGWTNAKSINGVTLISLIALKRCFLWNLPLRLTL